jgi:hypothetical protein
MAIASDKYPWALETMQIINRLTPDMKDKAFDPDWFLLRQRLEEFEAALASQTPTPPGAVTGTQSKTTESDLRVAGTVTRANSSAEGSVAMSVLESELRKLLDQGEPYIYHETLRSLLAVGPTSETGSIPAGARAQAEVWIRSVARIAVQLAIVRHDLTWDEEIDMTENEIAEDAVWAVFGEGTCSEEPIEAVTRLLDALAKNDAPPTVCPAGPVVEGELRALAAKWREESDWMTPSEYQTPRKAQLRICAEELEAALTNDPPPVGKPQDGQQSD